MTRWADMREMMAVQIGWNLTVTYVFQERQWQAFLTNTMKDCPSYFGFGSSIEHAIINLEWQFQKSQAEG